METAVRIATQISPIASDNRQKTPDRSQIPVRAVETQARAPQVEKSDHSSDPSAEEKSGQDTGERRKLAEA